MGESGTLGDLEVTVHDVRFAEEHDELESVGSHVEIDVTSENLSDSPRGGIHVELNCVAIPLGLATPVDSGGLRPDFEPGESRTGTVTLRVEHQSPGEEGQDRRVMARHGAAGRPRRTVERCRSHLMWELPDDVAAEVQ